VLSPIIKCLLWTPPTKQYATADVQKYQEFVTGIERYFTNAAAPPGSNGAGTEPVPRQYGVWGASFDGTCQQSTSAPNPLAPANCGPLKRQPCVDLNNHNAKTGTIPYEVTAALGSGVYSPNTIVVVFTRGWSYPPGSNGKPDSGIPQHWSMGPGQYIAAVATDMDSYEFAGHELIEAATDPDLNTGWYTNQNVADVQKCIAQNGSWGREVCDDGDATANVVLQQPLSDGFGGAGKGFTVVDAIDNIDGNNPASFTCPSSSNQCTAIGNDNQCPTLNGAPAVNSGNAFTGMTTTPPVTVVQTGTKLNVLARTPGGLVHLVSSNNGATFTTTTPAPGGMSTEPLTAYSKDGTTIDMYGRGTEGALYHWVYDGSTWAAPVSLGGYVIGPPSSAYIQSWQGNLAWALGSDQKIWVWINGTWNAATMPPNILAISPPQVFLRSPNVLDIYFTGIDGHVYLDAGWTGNWQQLPGQGYGLLAAINRSGNASRVDVFMQTLVGQGGSTPWWAEFQSGTLANNGLLNGLPLSVGPIGAVDIGNSSSGLVWLFFTQNNQMFGAVSDSTGTSFTNSSQLTGTPAVTSPITAFTPDNSNVMIYARRQSDGHLIQVRWVGTSMQPVQDLNVSIM
jgi:hypothetical protein